MKMAEGRISHSLNIFFPSFLWPQQAATLPLSVTSDLLKKLGLRHGVGVRGRLLGYSGSVAA
jgi:hypothetical protein